MAKLFGFKRLSVALLGAALVALPAGARMVNINIASGATGTSAIEGPETFGVAELDSVSAGWNNLSSPAPLLRGDGRPSSATVQFASPGGFNFFGAGYANSPLNFGIQQYAATPNPATITLSNLAAEFPNGYYAIVYVSGFIGNTGASIGNGSETYYYQTANPAPASFSAADLLRTSVDTAPAAGAAPVAHYAVFGSADAPMTADTVTFALRVTSGGGAGLGGVQIISAGPVEGDDDDREVRTWTDPSLGTYFLDAENGNDSNDGRSPESAWQTLAKLETRTFVPGDVILFKAGDVFTGSFFINGDGTPESPVVFGAYGTGTKPRLEGGPEHQEVILMFGNGGIEFRDLEISNYYPNGTIETRFGIRIVAPPRSGDIRHLHFHGMDFTWIKGSGGEHESRGIDAKTTTNNDARPATRWNGFVIEDCYFYQIDGRAVQVNDRNLMISNQIINGGDYYPTIGFVFQNNTGRDLYRNLLQLSGTKDAVIQHNYMSGTTVGSAFWPFNTDGTLVQFNDFRHMRNPDADSFICHFDYNCIDTVMQYNFGYDVDGGLIEIIVQSGFQFFQRRAIARYNMGIDVGFRKTLNSAGILLSGDVNDSQVYNNTIVTTDLHDAYKAISVRNWGGSWPLDNDIYNNIFLATGSPSTFEQPARLAQLGNVLSHNLYYGNIAAPTEDRFPIVADPMLVNPGGLNPTDMKLLPGSPAIGAGLIIPNNGGRDFFNNPVPADLIPSLGFHEFQTEGIDPKQWAGYPIGDDGFVWTGDGFLGWLWAHAARTSGWLYSATLNQWVFIPESQVAAGQGAWCYLHEASSLELYPASGRWAASASLGTWVALAESSTTATWVYLLDLAAPEATLMAAIAQSTVDSPMLQLSSRARAIQQLAFEEGIIDRVLSSAQLRAAFIDENVRRQAMRERGEVFYGPTQFRYDVWLDVWLDQLVKAMEIRTRSALNETIPSLEAREATAREHIHARISSARSHLSVQR